MRRRGSILILVLFVMGVLSLLAMSFAYRAALESRLASNRAIRAKLESQAASAVAVALGRLRENTNDYDHPAEPWRVHGPLATEGWLEDWGGNAKRAEAESVVDYQVIDEEGKLNVAYAPSVSLEKLGMSPQQIAGLFDWMDADDDSQADGAESDHYRSLPVPYRCKNGPLEMLDELLLVRGFGVADYRGEDADHDGELDPSENDGLASYPPDDADGQLRLGWVDLLTCMGDGHLNLNTAPLPVLCLLPLSEGAAEQIKRFVADGETSGDIENHAFRSAKDIEQLQGLSDADREVLKGIAAFKSEHFRIFAQAVHRPSGMRYQLEVLVRVSDGNAEILQWKAGH
ncbi:MAG: general secretion pathway protein GspK [Bacillota bacterium]